MNVKDLVKAVGGELLDDSKTHIFRMKIPSSSSNNIYTVAYRIKSPQWECDCLGWTMKQVPKIKCGGYIFSIKKKTVKSVAKYTIDYKTDRKGALSTKMDGVFLSVDDAKKAVKAWIKSQGISMDSYREQDGGDRNCKHLTEMMPTLNLLVKGADKKLLLAGKN
jgi:hypothetical protein